MLEGSALQSKLSSGKPVIGTWAIIPSTVTVDIAASTGLDFIIVDAEHGPIGFEVAQSMAMACEGRGISPLMRVGDITRDLIQRALDIGMHGIQVPNVETGEQAETVVRMSKYPPRGDRGFSPFTRSGGYSIENGKKITAAANRNTIVGVNVEGERALENIHEIVSVQDLDIVYVGTYDLSKSLGIPGQTEHPKVLGALAKTVATIRDAGKAAGTIVNRPEQIEEFLGMGVNFLVYLVDCEMFRQSYATVVDRFRRVQNV